MITLSSADLKRLTGAELVEQVRSARRSNGHTPADLEVDGREWRLYTSTYRGRGTRVHLWREMDHDGTTTVVHLQGRMDQRIGQMRPVD